MPHQTPGEVGSRPYDASASARASDRSSSRVLHVDPEAGILPDNRGAYGTTVKATRDRSPSTIATSRKHLRGETRSSNPLCDILVPILKNVLDRTLQIREDLVLRLGPERPRDLQGSSPFRCAAAGRRRRVVSPRERPSGACCRHRATAVPRSCPVVSLMPRQVMDVILAAMAVPGKADYMQIHLYAPICIRSANLSGSDRHPRGQEDQQDESEPG